MKKNIIFLIFGIAILAFSVIGYLKSAPGPENQTGPRPKIEITPGEFNFGEITFGQIVEHKFKVKNAGDAVLEIKRVGTSCGCTTAKVSSNKIDPGQEADLLVTYDTGAMSGPHGMGNQERIIYVKSNDPLTPQTSNVIYANVLSR